MIAEVIEAPQSLSPAVMPPDRTAGRVPVALVLMVLISSGVVAAGLTVPVLRPIAGLTLLVGVPTLLLRAKLTWPDGLPRTEVWLYALGLNLLGLYLVGLAINTVLPCLGVSRPLARWPSLVAADLVIMLLLLWRRDQNPYLWKGLRRSWTDRPGLGWPSRILLGGGTLAVVAGLAGALRLNNGASGAVATGALVVCLLLLVLAFAWASTVSQTKILISIYSVSLSMLLMTSMRGWYITGHDVQSEYQVYELTALAQHWDVSVLRSAYNACLSLTILPTVISELTAVPGLYLFKLLAQLLFAGCPVVVFLLARRFCSQRVALIAVVYFVAFPTFFTDMAFLVRQEVAFFFLALLLLAATSTVLSLRHSQVLCVSFGCGVVLSHYSTTYVLLAVLVASWLCSLAFRALPALARLPGAKPASLAPRESLVLSAVVVVPLAVITLLWTGPATHTGGQLSKTTHSVMAALTQHQSGDRSSDTGYSLFSGVQLSPQERLQQYRQQSLAQTASERADGLLYPLSEVDRYSPAAVPQPDLPLTAVGRALGSVGVDVATVNQVMRSWSARLLQIFIVIGLGLILLGRYRGQPIRRELAALACGSFAIVIIQVLLPAVSVDYGVLRAFQQALFILAPFLAVGSIALFGLVAERWSQPLAMGAATLFFLSLTGIIPQLLGGYPPQLHLNNAGQYYEIYYVQPEEVAAMQWLRQRIDTAPGSADGQVEITSDQFTASRLQTLAGVADGLYPTLLRRDAYVLLGAATVTDGDATLSSGGDLITYRYPTAFLDEHKSLLYASPKARIYR